MPFKIAAGVRADFEELLRKFQKTKCVRFEAFAAIWKDMKFSYIFSGHETRIELLTFTNECLVIALDFCLPPHSFQWRVGGLYLLYSLYNKQPNAANSKIRVTRNHWQEIQNLIKDVTEQEHHDVHFVYWKLRQHNAFHFVAFPKQMAPYLKSGNEFDGSRCFLESSALKDMLDEEYCTPLEQIHQRYVDIKKELLPTDSALSLVEEDLLSIVVKKIDDFEKNRLKVVDGYLNETMESRKPENDDEDLEQDDIGVRRDRLKKRLMSEKGTTSRSRRHRAVESKEENSDTSARKKGKRRKITSKNIPTDEETDVEEDCSNRLTANEECNMSMPSFSKY